MYFIERRKMEKAIRKLLLTALIVTFVANFSLTANVRADENISDFDNVAAEQVINDINSTVNSGISEGEIKYDRNYTTYAISVSPNPAIIGDTVTAEAETDNSRVTHVIFVWVNLQGIKKIETVNVNSEKTAQSRYVPDELGRWWVFALFIKKGSCCWLYAMRWTCFKVTEISQVVPDFPVVGTAGAATTMLAGLGFFLNRRKQPSTKH
jgi:hypothetical protein